MGMIECGFNRTVPPSYDSFRTFDVSPPEGVEVTAIYSYIKRVDSEDDQSVSEFPTADFFGKAAFDMSFASNEYEYIVICFNGDDPVAFYRANAWTLQNLDRINLIPWTS